MSALHDCYLFVGTSNLGKNYAERFYWKESFMANIFRAFDRKASRIGHILCFWRQKCIFLWIPKPSPLREWSLDVSNIQGNPHKFQFMRDGINVHQNRAVCHRFTGIGSQITLCAWRFKFDVRQWKTLNRNCCQWISIVYDVTLWNALWVVWIVLNCIHTRLFM